MEAVEDGTRPSKTQRTTPVEMGANGNPYPQEWQAPACGLSHAPTMDPHLSFDTRSDKIICVMVGLPARGKSYMALRLSHYISFFYGTPTKIFNVGEYRREKAVAAGYGRFQPASFFNPANKEAAALRQSASEDALNHLLAWMETTAGAHTSKNDGKYMPGDFGAVAFYDATNATAERRRWLMERVKPSGAKVIFIESICTDEAIVSQNIMAAKISGKDYASIGTEEAIADFRARIDRYNEVYEELCEKELSWIKLVDAGRAASMNSIRGFLPSRIAQFLFNVHVQRRPFYFSRHGQSEYNALGKIGGDSKLTAHGEEYALALGSWAEQNIMHLPDGTAIAARLWTSSLQRTILTARHIPHPTTAGPEGIEWVQMRPKVFRNLDEIYAGSCDGMTYEQIADLFPAESAERKKAKFAYRYPRGESYTDLIARLEPIAHELERQRDPILVVAHQAILRVLYAYLMGMPREKCIDVSIPLNTVIKLTPTSFGCEEERFVLVPHPEGITLDPASH